MLSFVFLLNGSKIGRTPKGAYSTRGHSRHLLETAFSEPLLRTLLRTLFYCKTHRRPPSQNPSENPFPRTLPRTFSEPFSERCVAVRPLRRAPSKNLIFIQPYTGLLPKTMSNFDWSLVSSIPTSSSHSSCSTEARQVSTMDLYLG